MMFSAHRTYNDAYAGERLEHVAFPLGGIGAGMICLDGSGSLSHFSLRNQPDLLNQPCVFSAVYARTSRTESVTRVLEGPVPSWKVFGLPDAGNGWPGSTYGLPRFAHASFHARFPFGMVKLDDTAVPLSVAITGWSPFIPGDADNSSLPVAALEFCFRNKGQDPVEAIYSFNTVNFMATGAGSEVVLPAERGFTLWQPGSEEKPWEEGAFCASIDDEATQVNYAWFRGGWFDPLSMTWREIEEGECVTRPPLEEGDPSPGASIGVPFRLAPREEKTVRLMLAWYVPKTNQRSLWPPCADVDCEAGSMPSLPTYSPWYSFRFQDVGNLFRYWHENYDSLRERSQRFSDCFYDTTLPSEVVEAVAANLTILKSPTILRQTSGRLWFWEGCQVSSGCCAGSCTHVWNYAQALSHLFPELERSLRQTQFHESQDECGHQSFRSPLPTGRSIHDKHAAADGQLGGIMQVYRDWRISGDTEWLREIWPRVKRSLHYCIETWDPRLTGTLEEPHHNTYDVEFWGPDSMCSSIYLGALLAAATMGGALSDDVSLYVACLKKGRERLETELFNGDYFFQRIQWRDLDAADPLAFTALHDHGVSAEAAKLMAREGPKYQYGKGCLSDGVIGAWLAAMSGLGDILDAEKVASHLQSIYRYNFQKDLSAHANPQRPGFALGKEGGLLLCTWPRGERPSLPFPYSDEVWTGIEYEIASHLLLVGKVKEGLEIVRTCRDRYDGRVRNPFDEYECGHWYARAMASYALLQGLTGVQYDAVEKTLYVHPRVEGDFRSFLCTATGYGTVGVRAGEPFVEVRQGHIDVRHIDYQAVSRSRDVAGRS
jgi:uncharacterized protein (DUF608 family)